MFFLPKKQSILLISLCLIFICSQFGFARDVKWREITPAELSMTKPTVEADADAEAIFWEVRINDRSRSKLTLEHYVRVKIFTERGREKYSKFDIPYTKRMRIRDVAARVIRPDGSIVEIDKNDIFERDIVKVNKTKVKAKSFAVPNIEPGVIVEYQYREIIRNAGAVGMKLVFQRDVPVQKLSYFYRPYSKKSKPRFQSYNMDDTRFVKDEKGFYLAERTNVAAFKEEPFMPPEDQVRPWMQLNGLDLTVTSASSNSVRFVIKDPSNPGSFWGAYGIEKNYWVKFMTDKDKLISKTTEEVTASAKTDEEKLKKIYEFVQTEINNTSYDSTLTEDERDDLPKIRSIKDVLKKKQASSFFIDLLFGAMASNLGLETKIAYTADRSEMFFDPNMTNEDFVQLRAIAVRVNGDWKFYHPGSKFLPEGMLSWDREDVWALLIGKKDYAWVKTPYTGIDKSNAKRTADFKLLDDGSLEGNMTVEYFGQMAYIRRLNAFGESDNKRQEDIIESVKSRISTAEVSNVSLLNPENHRLPLIEKYTIKIPNYAQKTGKRIFFQPGVFEYGNKPVFSTDSRKYDIYFNYPWAENDEIRIKLPEGYSLDNAESPDKINDTGNIGLLKIDIGIDKAKNTLVYKRNFHFANGTMLIKAASYPSLKQLFDSFNQADAHTITLKKE